MGQSNHNIFPLLHTVQTADYKEIKHIKYKTINLSVLYQYTSNTTRSRNLSDIGIGYNFSYFALLVFTIVEHLSNTCFTQVNILIL